MSWYDDDFYNEPSEFDMLVGEFKESLMKSVKESYVKEMEQLKKENEELKEFRKERQTGWYAEWCVERYLPKCDK